MTNPTWAGYAIDEKSVRTKTANIGSILSEDAVIALATIIEPGSETVKVTITNAQTKLVIGRDARADIIVKDEAVSRLHAVISHDRGKFFVEDLHSKNGTVLNGKYLSGKRARLVHNDEILIGNVKILFQTSTAEGEDEGDAWRAPTATAAESVPTGYGLLDAHLGGGMPKGYAVVLLSHSCDERDLLLTRTIESSVRAGRPSYFVSNDPSRITQFAGFSRDFYSFSTRANKTTVQHDSDPTWIPGVENLSELSISLSEGIARTRVDQRLDKLMIVEILPDILLEHKSTVTRRWLSDFIIKRKAQSFTLLFTLNPSIASESEVSAVVDLFDGVLRLSEVETKSGTKTFIAIRRMFARNCNTKDIPLSRAEMFKLRTS
jgi:pSer/pThr/pTyr-binding forkhead associated (FHA) protein